MSNHAEAAKMIRTELKKNGIQATVKSKVYSGGSSITVTILADVLPATRKAVEAFANRFQYGHFDGMTDSYEYSNRDKSLPQVRFVFVNVAFSDEIIEAAKAFAGNSEFWGTLNGAWRGDEFWAQRKPRISAA